MLDVMTLSEADALLMRRFHELTPVERTPLNEALTRVLAEDVYARDDVPDFVRSTVDGYAVRAADTFGCSESVPALLNCVGEVRMGEPALLTLHAGECAATPTGGELPQNADAMVMLEYAEELGGGAVAVEKPSAPGAHLVFVGDDVKKGERVLPRGRRLTAQDIGTLAAIGRSDVSVHKRPLVAIISTGDELVAADAAPARGQVRDVNGPMLAALCREAGAEPVLFGAVRDDERAIEEALLHAVRQADAVLMSGGSSVGVRDAAARIIERNGELLFHGLSVKPGKPTMCGIIGRKPVVGLPGHPVAAYFIGRLMVRPMLLRMQGTSERPVTREMKLSSALPSNHGREEYVPVRFEQDAAVPLIGKSGLVSILTQADGYICIPRDAEGCMRGEQVTAYLL